jgi:hypothetical protein
MARQGDARGEIGLAIDKARSLMAARVVAFLASHATIRRWLDAAADGWATTRATLEAAYFRIEADELEGDLRRLPSTVISIAFHGVILAAVILRAFLLSPPGGPSKSVSVEVVMLRPSTADPAPGVPSKAPITPSQSVSGSPVTSPNPDDSLTVPQQAPSSFSPAAQSDALPEPKPSGATSSQQTETPQDNDAATVATPNTKPSESGAPVASGSQQVALQNALRGQMMACWAPPLMAGRAGLMPVDFILELKPDGTLARPPELTPEMAAEAPTNPALRAAADAVREALKFCGPFKLPAETYDQWQEINPFHFDPRAFMPQ